MSDLVERLRSCSEDFRVEYREAEGCSIYAEAADEIERNRKEIDGLIELLRKARVEIERLREQVVNLQTRNNALYEAIDILKRGGKLK